MFETLGRLWAPLGEIDCSEWVDTERLRGRLDDVRFLAVDRFSLSALSDAESDLESDAGSDAGAGRLMFVVSGSGALEKRLLRWYSDESRGLCMFM